MTHMRPILLNAIFIPVLLKEITGSFWSASSSFPSPVVRTNNGAVRGKVVLAASDRYAQEFLNIPYAQPPLGALRFLAPLPVNNWSDERDGTKAGNACVQSNAELGELFEHAPYKLDADLSTISEDCLILNVFAPHHPPAVSNGKNKNFALLPVLIWLHGGGFQWGSSNLPVYNASILSSEINAIVVTVNYRLGALGFFTLADVDGVSGNQGLLDQSLAIKWVHDNARHFGGNPDRITLVGQSAGGASVQYHTMSHMSRDFFAQSIMQSGTAVSFWGYHTPQQARKASRAFATSLGCNKTDDCELFDCVKTKSIEEFWTADIAVQQSTKMPLVPTIDGVFLKKSPTDHLREGDFKQAPAIIGGTTNESLWSLSVYWPEEVLFKLPNVQLNEQQLDSMLFKMTSFVGDASRDAIKFIYRNWAVGFNGQEMLSERWRTLATVCDDLFNNIGMIKTLDAYLAAKVPIYRYQFDHISKVTMFGYNYNAVVHCDEVPFFFGHPLDPRYQYPKEEVYLSQRILQAIGGFAHYGNPSRTALGVFATDNWPLYEGRTEYFKMDERSYGKTGVGPERWRFEFWNRAVPYLSKLEAQAFGFLGEKF